MCSWSRPARPRSRPCRVARPSACRSCRRCRACSSDGSPRPRRTARRSSPAPRERRVVLVAISHVRIGARPRLTRSIGRPVPRKADRLVEQRLVGDDLPARLPASAVTITFGSASSMRVARLSGEAAEHDRVDRADAHRRQHREDRLRDHRHVDQYAVARSTPERDQRRGAVHFARQFGKGVTRSLFGLGRDEDQRRLIGARGEMAVDGVVAEVGAAADEPARERRSAIVETSVNGVCQWISARARARSRRGLERATMELCERRCGVAHDALSLAAAEATVVVDTHRHGRPPCNLPALIVPRRRSWQKMPATRSFGSSR